MPSLIVTLIGPDQPGLVGKVSALVRQHDGNWLESRMAHLAGQFAGIVRIDVDESMAPPLLQALKNLKTAGLQVVAELDSTAPASPEGKLWNLNVVGNDRPGIVREVTEALVKHAVNVEELSTTCEEAPQSGGMLFKAEARVTVPATASLDQLQSDLEAIATDLMIDFQQ